VSLRASPNLNERTVKSLLSLLRLGRAAGSLLKKMMTSLGPTCNPAIDTMEGITGSHEVHAASRALPLMRRT